MKITNVLKYKYMNTTLQLDQTRFNLSNHNLGTSVLPYMFMYVALLYILLTQCHYYSCVTMIVHKQLLS